MTGNKFDLLNRGTLLLYEFCGANNLAPPEIRVRHRAEWAFDACAYYRPSYIEICVSKCAAIGVAGPAWSFPGYAVDRTPYGVLQHELGHHADVVKSSKVYRYFGEYSIAIRSLSGEEKLTNYCPNDGEWFAEMFRLFVTNPDLLRHLRPKTYALIAEDFAPAPSLANVTWKDVLKDAPDRTIRAAESKIKKKG